MEVNLYNYAKEGIKRRIDDAKHAADVIVQSIDELEKIEKIILYGRIARNDWREGTDTDILIIFKRKIGFEGFAKLDPVISRALETSGLSDKDLHIEQCDSQLFNYPPENAHIMNKIKSEPFFVLYE